jgi:hypothetical protein
MSGSSVVNYTESMTGHKTLFIPIFLPFFPHFPLRQHKGGVGVVVVRVDGLPGVPSLSFAFFWVSLLSPLLS